MRLSIANHKRKKCSWTPQAIWIRVKAQKPSEEHQRRDIRNWSTSWYIGARVYRRKVYECTYIALLPAIYRNKNYTESLLGDSSSLSPQPCARLRGCERDDSRGRHFRHAGANGWSRSASTTAREPSPEGGPDRPILRSRSLTLLHT